MAINRAETKKRLLIMSKDFRNGKFTRVSKDALDALEAKHELAMRMMIQHQPSRGKTVMPI